MFRKEIDISRPNIGRLCWDTSYKSPNIGQNCIGDTRSTRNPQYGLISRAKGKTKGSPFVAQGMYPHLLIP